MKYPLEGIKVVELARVLAGPWVGQVLSDLGAEVIKIESPEGDETRKWGPPFVQGESGDLDSAYFQSCNRGKRSIVLDFKDEEDLNVANKLIKKSDVLIENFKVGGLKKYKLDYASVSKLNPKLIYCSITGFGQTGPSANRPGFASIGEAMGGIRFINGFPNTPPPRFGISLGDTLTAMFAVEGFLMALFEREKNNGTGQIVDAAITESCFSMLESTLTEYDKCGIIRKPSGTGLANVAPSNIYPTLDENFVVVAANLDPMFKRLCEAMDKVEWASDPRFIDHKARGDNASELDSLISDWTKTLTMKDIGQKLDDHGVVWGPINSIEDIVEDEQFKSREMILEIDDETFGSLKVPGIVPKLSKTPGKVNWLGPQKVGSHNNEVLSELGFSDEDQKELLDKKII